MDALIYFYFIFFFKSGDYRVPPGVVPWHVWKDEKKGVTDLQ